MNKLVEQKVKDIALNPIKLKDLDGKRLNKIGQAVVFDELKGEMKSKVGLYRIKYEEEKAKYLGRFCYYTALNYVMALNCMEEYVRKINISPLELTFQQADDFVIGIIKDKSPGTVRLIVAGCSSFFTWLERRYDVIRNPFRGCRERPKKRNIRALGLPEEWEIDKVIKSSTGALSPALMMLRDCGLRVGALPGLTVRDGRYTTWSKGKQISGEMSIEALKMMRKKKLNLNKPFGNYTDRKIKCDIQYQITRLVNKGKIKTRFSPHDCRHLYAIKKYKETKDMMKVRDLLGHSSVSMTELYLRGLGII